MKPTVSQLVDRFDGYQQRHAWLGFPVAVIRKFSEDQASNLAALLAYYAFFSFFPLLLVLVTVLGLVVADRPKIEDYVVNSVLSQVPVIGDQIRENAHGLAGGSLVLVFGVGTALWAGLALANAAQSALNTVWQVPIFARPNIILRILRSLLMVVVLGAFVLLTTAGSAVVAGARSYGLGIGVLAQILAVVVALLVNILVFTLAFRVLTERDIATRDVLPGAVVAAIGWQGLQLAGGYYLAHLIKGASQAYGTFAIVMGLLTWFYLQAQLTLFAAELNVVRYRRLWPRSVVAPPPRTAADRTTYQGYADAVRFHPDERVETSFDTPENTPSHSPKC